MIVNEGSEAVFTARPINTSGALFTPTNARYRLDDSSSKAALIAWTVLTPSTAMTITIPATSNAIIKTSCKREKKVLTVETDYGTSSAHNQDFSYWVKNLQFVS